MFRITLLVFSLILVGCSSPDKIIYVQEKSQEAAVAYQQNMARIATGTLRAYQSSENARVRTTHESWLGQSAASHEGMVPLLMVKILTNWLVDQLDETSASVLGVKVAIAEAEVDFQRYLELTKSITKYLRKTGLQPEHLQMVRGYIEEASADFLEAKRLQTLAKLEKKIIDLESNVAKANSEGPEAAEIAAALKRELDNSRRSKELFEAFTKDQSPVEPPSGEND